MTAIRLHLRRRKSDAEVTMPLAALEEMLRNKSDSEFAENFRVIVRNKDGYIHDKKWLEMISGHAQEGGNSLDDLWPWLKLRTRIAKLDDTKEGFFNLSPEQVVLFKKRLKDKNFKIGVLPASFAEFLLDFCEATKWSPDENEKVDWVDLDALDADNAPSPAKEAVANGFEDISS